MLLDFATVREKSKQPLFIFIFIFIFISTIFHIFYMAMGCSQVVRRQVLALVFEGSSPSSPELIYLVNQCVYVYISLYIYINKSQSFKKMAHRKNPYALRRRRNLSNPVFLVYTRKDYTIKSWTNRLKRLKRAKLFGQKAKQPTGRTAGAFKIRHSPNKNKTNNKKQLQKQTHAVTYSSHFSNSIYRQYSKAVFFKNSKIQKKQSKKNRLSNKSFAYYLLPVAVV